MYRIYINKSITNFALNFEKILITQKKCIQNLKVFKKDLSCKDKSFETKAKKYIQAIIDSYKTNGIVSAKPSSFSTYQKKFENIIAQKDLVTKITCKINKRDKTTHRTRRVNSTKEFWNHLVRVMDHESLKKEYYESIEKIGIFVCVYCNMAPADKSSKKKSNYEMEHFWPKNKFPFLSTSFFNLFPSCSTCNKKKGKVFDAKGFNLYREKKSDCANPFSFEVPTAVLSYSKIPKRSREKALEKFSNDESINIIFGSPLCYAKAQINKLEIQDRYNCHRVREKIFDILYKYERYSGNNIKVFKKSFPKLALETKNIFDVFGDYSEEKDIHKKQLTKISIDFGKKTGML